MSGVDDGFSKSVAARANEYLEEIIGDRDGVYDLGQLPRGRPRYAWAGAPLFWLTAHTRMIWSPRAGRCLRRQELAAAMGIPGHPALVSTYGLSPICLDHLSGSASARLAGNAMCVPCVGVVMPWRSAFCVPGRVPLLRDLQSATRRRARLDCTSMPRMFR